VKTVAVCAGLLLSLSAGAQDPVNAKLVGQRVVSSFPGAPILICRYRGPEAKYEVVASTPTCAPFFRLSTSDTTAPTLAKTPSPQT
jgi:hypothetical protein